jgi:transcriptional regulator with XRE-family HTH domain
LNYINCGRCLSVAQSQFGLSNVDVAERLDIAPQQVSRWKNGENMKLHTIQDLCEVFGITLEEFFSLT